MVFKNGNWKGDHEWRGFGLCSDQGQGNGQNHPNGMLMFTHGEEVVERIQGRQACFCPLVVKEFRVEGKLDSLKTPSTHGASRD